jgi:threonine dehydratase
LGEQRIPRLKDVYSARVIVNRHLNPTPLIHSRQLSRVIGCEVYLKLENLQPTRAFKVRGGVYYMERMKEEAVKRGVVTASTGNHAQSIAYAGLLFGVDVNIVMPNGVPNLKVQAVKDLGANVIFQGTVYEEALDYSKKLSSEKGYLFIHGINEPLLHEGVATMHLEVFEQQPDVSVVFNPIGGGSGASGACIVYKTLDPSIKVLGVQAEGAPAFYLSWKAGEVKSTDGVKTAAEGLATSRAYELSLRSLTGRLDDVVLVSDAEMRRAVKSLYLATGQVAEMSGAASLAAAFKNKGKLEGKKVVLLVTGGNIQTDQLISILSEENN